MEKEDKIKIFPRLLEGKEKDIPGCIDAIRNAIVVAKTMAESNNVEERLTIDELFTCRIIEEYVNNILSKIAEKKNMPFNEVKGEYIKQINKITE